MLSTAAAEIAKILSAPSARDIVLGHHSSHHSSSSPKIATWDSDSDTDSSSKLSSKGSSAANPTPWLKTPSEEGKFTYTHKRLVRFYAPMYARPEHSPYMYHDGRGPPHASAQISNCRAAPSPIAALAGVT